MTSTAGSSSSPGSRQGGQQEPDLPRSFSPRGIAPSLLRLDRLRISLLGSVDLGVGRVVGAGLAVRVIHAGRVSRFAGLDLGTRGVGVALLPGLVIHAVRVAPLQ